MTEKIPSFLYKVLSVQDWEASQGQSKIKLSPEDHKFIHLSKEDQLGKIRAKYWNHVPHIILKLATAKLPGKLVFEANPGGTNKYYHLYNGFIPLNAVSGVHIIS